MANSLNYQVKGNGSPVIFLHGFLESSRMWENITISEGIQAVYIDLPGHGMSIDSNHLCPSMEEMAELVVRVVDSLDITSYNLIGHSMGGYVSLALKNMDNRCKKVMLLNSNFWCDSDLKKKERRRIAEIVKTNLSHFLYEVIPNLFIDPKKHDDEVKDLLKDALKMSSSAVSSASIAMSNRRDYKSLIQKSPNHFTIIQGDQDPIVNHEEMILQIGDIELNFVELRGVGHMAHIESPIAVNACIKDFLVPVIVKNPY